MIEYKEYTGRVYQIKYGGSYVRFRLSNIYYQIKSGSNCIYDYYSNSIDMVLKENDSIYYNPTKSDTFYVISSNNLVYKYIPGKKINCKR
jgi:hypothetical protein